MELCLFFVIILLGLFVAADAKKLGIQKGRFTGFFDLSPEEWGAGVLILCFVFLPAYFFMRKKHKQLFPQPQSLGKTPAEREAFQYLENGICSYCKSPVVPPDRHLACKEKADNAVAEISKAISETANAKSLSTNTVKELKKSILASAAAGAIPDDILRKEVVSQWEKTVNQATESGIISEMQTHFLTQLKNTFALTEAELDKSGAFTTVKRSNVIRSVLNGELPTDNNAHGVFPVNLQKDEEIIWAFHGAEYLEDKVRRTYIGSSSGVSVRIMKGVSVRSGGFRGQAVEHQERIHVDTGTFLTTNKNLYFIGEQKSIRVPYKKIVSFISFSDGIGIIRDAATAKPQIFVTNDGWFTYNLVAGLAQIAK